MKTAVEINFAEHSRTLCPCYQILRARRREPIPMGLIIQSAIVNAHAQGAAWLGCKQHARTVCAGTFSNDAPLQQNSNLSFHLPLMMRSYFVGLPMLWDRAIPLVDF